MLLGVAEPYPAQSQRLLQAEAKKHPPDDPDLQRAGGLFAVEALNALPIPVGPGMCCFSKPPSYHLQ